MSRARHKTDRKREQWAAAAEATRDARRGAGTRAFAAACAGGAAITGGAGDAIDAVDGRHENDVVEARIAQARGALRRGELRRAATLVREACSLDEMRARTWTILGALLTRGGRRDEARGAFKHALWLRSRAGEERRAKATRALLDSLEPCAV